MSINEGSRELMLYYSCLFIILTQFAGNNTIVQQVQVKGKGFKKWLFKPSMPLCWPVYFIVWKVGFIHYGWWRHITYDVIFFYTRIYLYASYWMRISFIFFFFSKPYLFTLHLDNDLYSHVIQSWVSCNIILNIGFKQTLLAVSGWHGIWLVSHSLHFREGILHTGAGN